MALIFKDRVRETTTTTGTGTVTLAGAVTGYQAWSEVGNGNTAYYCIAGQGTTEWEVGLGTYTASGTTLARTTPMYGSAGAATLVNFSAGTKDVFLTVPADFAAPMIVRDGSTIVNPANLLIFANGTVTDSGGGWVTVSGLATQAGAETLTNKVVQLTAAPANQGYSGETISLTYGESIVPGDILYIKSDGAVWKADANAATLYPAVGLALETASSGAHLVLLRGIYRDDSRYAFTVGGVVYLSTTAGGETQTAPSATDDVVQVLGVATHADRIYFNPSLNYITRV